MSVEFHRLLDEEAGDPLPVESTGPIRRTVQRVMGEVLHHGDPPAWVWRDHAEILDAVEAGEKNWPAGTRSAASGSSSTAITGRSPTRC